MTTTVPNGCRHCGIAERPHARQWTEEAGWHSWEQPTTGQIKDRMRARGTVPTKTGPGSPATEPIYCGMRLYGSDVGVPGHDSKGPAYINPACPDHDPEPAPPHAPEESTVRETAVTRVKHSGPDTRFCVLCLSGDHATEEPAQ